MSFKILETNVLLLTNYKHLTSQVLITEINYKHNLSKEVAIPLGDAVIDHDVCKYFY